jgi:hypothetical protein
MCSCGMKEANLLHFQMATIKGKNLYVSSSEKFQNPINCYCLISVLLHSVERTHPVLHSKYAPIFVFNTNRKLSLKLVPKRKNCKKGSNEINGTYWLTK